MTTTIRSARSDEVDIVFELWQAMGYELLDGVGRYIKDLSAIQVPSGG